MWGAIEFAYHFLRDEVAQTDRSNHIIVLTDGPDTCAGEQLLSCQTTCTTADPHALAAKIQADHNDANAPRIRIHFVQFEALGYPGRDARQVEMACVSGGHYQFINSNAFPRGQTAILLSALETAVANLRFALMGHWELALPSPAYADSGVVPAGALYGLQGTLIVPASSNMVVIDTAFPFGVGQGKEAEEVTNWDRRPTLRKPCSGAADCGASSGACSIGCSAETGLCPGPDDPSELPDLATCETGGSDGFCCGGTCQSSGGCGDCP